MKKKKGERGKAVTDEKSAIGRCHHKHKANHEFIFSYLQPSDTDKPYIVNRIILKEKDKDPP